MFFATARPPIHLPLREANFMTRARKLAKSGRGRHPRYVTHPNTHARSGGPIQETPSPCDSGASRFRQYGLSLSPGLVGAGFGFAGAGGVGASAGGFSG